MHVLNKYVHMHITNNENMVRITNWQEFTKKKLRMSKTKIKCSWSCQLKAS